MNDIDMEIVAKALRAGYVDPELYSSWEATDEESRNLWRYRARELLETLDDAGLFIGIKG